MKEYSTACPRNCYSTCSLKVLVEDGKIKKIHPHPHNRATAEGVCLKGQSYLERVYSEDRLLFPLRKNRKTGEFERISWDEAISDISSRLLKYKETYGPQSVMFLSGSGTKGILNEVSSSFWNLFGGYTTTYGDLCWPSGLEATRLSLGEIKHSAPWDIEHAKLIICWGKNPAETNIHQLNFIEAAKSKGAKLIVVDPRRTATADRADFLVQLRPGTDGALALGVANHLIQEGHIDKSFIQENITGFDQFSEMVKKYPVDKVSDITDVPVRSIVELAENIGTISPMTMTCGYGMQRFSNGGQSVRSILALLAITGNLGRKGAGWVYANLSSHVFKKIKDPFCFYPTENQNNKVRMGVSITKLGSDILEQKNPPIKMIWVERGNPVAQVPETPMVLKAFQETDFCVVVDQFLTDTALEADIVLPAKTMFEQTDLINAYWHDYIQLLQKVIDPPGEVKPETEIYRSLAIELGFEREEIQRNIPGPDDEDIVKYLEKKLEPFGELSIKKLREGPLLSPFFEEIAWENLDFPTPSGKIELFSVEAKARWGVDPLPVYSEPIESPRVKDRGKYPLSLLTPNSKNTIHSQFVNLQVIREIVSEPEVMVNPQDAFVRGIEEGDRIRIFNERGELVLKAAFDFGVKPGCVVVFNGWWGDSGAGVNQLSLGRETDIGYGAAFHDTTVQIEKVN